MGSHPALAHLPNPQELKINQETHTLSKFKALTHLTDFIFSFYISAEYCCNGCVVEDEELGKVLQLQGDQRKNVSAFLISNELAKKDTIKIHGF
jgi:translation initiation factor SUI1